MQLGTFGAEGAVAVTPTQGQLHNGKIIRFGSNLVIRCRNSGVGEGQRDAVLVEEEEGE